ncbi:NUC153 domain-containing protein [Citrus sinensis]|uniref:NUC153 domain-containing protein n=1 Tax=Citrus sinensis TaxID=2711 RepID=A0ACB8IZE1_CITSI|nr:NUC153 domain-containing protein [Citrus sinensis]
MGSKNKNKRKNRSKDGSDNNKNKKIITDSRFASVHSDPRFQNVPKQKSKVAIDSRFDRMFTDKNFASSTAPFDKRGKPKKNLKTSKSSLQHYYRIEEEDKKSDEDEEIEEEERRNETDSESELKEAADVSSGSGTEEEDDDDVLESTTDDEEEDVDFDEGSEEEEEAIPEIDNETHRLAIVNMDWRHVKAVDLFVILSSFLPKDGQILSVAVYPSEFGIQRMKEEDVRGPVGLFDSQNENSDDEDNDEIDEEKLRAYEKSRLRYYYAVVECDSSATADYLYRACDGVEFERSSNKLDLRFIPDTMEFKYPPRDVATEAPANYGGLDFFTKALQHSNVQLSWDDDEPDRVKTLKRKFNADQVAELELKEFLASDESETDDEDDNVADEQSDKKSKKQDKYRALLESGDGSDEDGEEDGQDMEVTFNTGLEDISKRILEKKDKKSETIWEAYLRKRREKKKAGKNKSKYSSDDEASDTDREAIEEPDDFFVEEPKGKKGEEAGGNHRKEEKEQQDTDKEATASTAELELLLADDKGAENGLKGYNMKPKKRKGKKGKEVPDEDKIPTADYDDPRFSALFTSPLFALDPTDPQFKRSAAYARQIAQKKQKGDQREQVIRESTKIPTNAQMPSDDPDRHRHMKSDVSSLKRENHEVSLLVKSLKMKSKQIQLPSVGKMPKKDKGVQSKDVEENNGLSNLVQSLKKTKKLKK